MKQYIRPALAGALLWLVWCPASSAATGWCQAPQGTTDIPYDLGSLSLSNPADNYPGYSFPPVQIDMSAPTTAGMECDCPTTTNNYYMWGDSVLPRSTVTDGRQYFHIPGNDEFEVAVDVWSLLYGFVNVPFDKLQNDGEVYQCHPAGSQKAATTGSTAKMYLRLKKKLIGTVNIPNTIVTSIYWTADIATSHGPTPWTNMILGGSITVPQNCEIAGGSTISVDFGQIPANTFSVPGGLPQKNVTRNISVPVQCNGWVEGDAQVILTLSADPAGVNLNTVKSTNADIGIAIGTDQNLADSSRWLVPQTGAIPFTLDGSGRAQIELYASPVRIGDYPTPGSFTAIATLRIEFP